MMLHKRLSGCDKRTEDPNIKQNLIQIVAEQSIDLINQMIG